MLPEFRNRKLRNFQDSNYQIQIQFQWADKQLHNAYINVG